MTDDMDSTTHCALAKHLRLAHDHIGEARNEVVSYPEHKEAITKALDAAETHLNRAGLIWRAYLLTHPTTP